MASTVDGPERSLTISLEATPRSPYHDLQNARRFASISRVRPLNLRRSSVYHLLEYLRFDAMFVFLHRRSAMQKAFPIYSENSNLSRLPFAVCARMGIHEDYWNVVLEDSMPPHEVFDVSTMLQTIGQKRQIS
jgi:hypothetical protein